MAFWVFMVTMNLLNPMFAVLGKNDDIVGALGGIICAESSVRNHLCHTDNPADWLNLPHGEGAEKGV